MREDSNLLLDTPSLEGDRGGRMIHYTNLKYFPPPPSLSAAITKLSSNERAPVPPFFFFPSLEHNFEQGSKK